MRIAVILVVVILGIIGFSRYLNAEPSAPACRQWMHTPKTVIVDDKGTTIEFVQSTCVTTA